MEPSNKKRSFSWKFIFPIQLEEPHDPTVHSLCNFSILKMTSISHKYKNCTATYYFAKAFEIYSYKEEDEFYKFSDKLIKDLHLMYQKELKITRQLIIP